MYSSALSIPVRLLYSRNLDFKRKELLCNRILRIIPSPGAKDLNGVTVVIHGEFVLLISLAQILCMIRK